MPLLQQRTADGSSDVDQEGRRSMKAAQIQAAIGCTEEQAHALLAHMQTGAAVGAWTQTQRTIKRCEPCGKRQWHDGDQCMICEGRNG